MFPARVYYDNETGYRARGPGIFPLACGRMHDTPPLPSMAWHGSSMSPVDCPAPMLCFPRRHVHRSHPGRCQVSAPLCTTSCYYEIGLIDRYYVIGLIGPRAIGRYFPLLIPDCECVSRELCAEDKFLVIASDGLWEARPQPLDVGQNACSCSGW